MRRRLVFHVHGMHGAWARAPFCSRNTENTMHFQRLCWRSVRVQDAIRAIYPPKMKKCAPKVSVSPERGAFFAKNEKNEVQK